MMYRKGIFYGMNNLLPKYDIDKICPIIKTRYAYLKKEGKIYER